LHYSLFLPFTDSLHLPQAALVCSANELHYRLCYTSIKKSQLILYHKQL